MNRRNCKHKKEKKDGRKSWGGSSMNKTSRNRKMMRRDIWHSFVRRHSRKRQEVRRKQKSQWWLRNTPWKMLEELKRLKQKKRERSRSKGNSNWRMLPRPGHNKQLPIRGEGRLKGEMLNGQRCRMSNSDIRLRKTTPSEQRKKRKYRRHDGERSKWCSNRKTGSRKRRE